MHKIGDFKLKHNIIISCIFAIIIIISFSKQDLLINYNLISFFVFSGLFYLIYRIDLNYKDKRELYINIFLALLYSVFMIVGRNAYTFAFDKNVDILLGIFSLKSVYHFISYFVLFFSILNHLIKYLSIADFQSEKKITNKSKMILFIITFIVILISWLPYFLTLYPGAVTPDSLSEFKDIQKGIITSDHHPVAHQIFMLIFYNIGLKIFGTVNEAIATISVVQMIIMALIFSYTVVFMYRKKIKLFLIIFVILYYSISPIFGYYSVTMWKDVLFGGFMLLFIINIINLIDNSKLTIKDFSIFSVISLLVIFFRNNAIYMYIIFIPFILCVLKKYRKQFVITFLIILSVFYIIKHPVYNLYKISSSESAEYIGIPLQQIGRMSYKNVYFTREQKRYINKLIPINIMKEVYNPQASDAIKFNSNYNPNYFNDNKLEFFKIYLQLVLKYPAISIESYFVSTIGYYYPNFLNWTLANNVWENNLGIYNSPKAPKCIIEYVKNVESRDIPIISMQWSIGLCFWIILLFALIMSIRKGLKYLTIYIPIFGIWITMMIASPLWGEFRYVFCAFTALPLLILVPYMDINLNGEAYVQKNEKDR